MNITLFGQVKLCFERAKHGILHLAFKADGRGGMDGAVQLNHDTDHNCSYFMCPSNCFTLSDGHGVIHVIQSPTNTWYLEYNRPMKIKYVLVSHRNGEAKVSLFDIEDAATAAFSEGRSSRKYDRQILSVHILPEEIKEDLEEIINWRQNTNEILPEPEVLQEY